MNFEFRLSSVWWESFPSKLELLFVEWQLHSNGITIMFLEILQLHDARLWDSSSLSYFSRLPISSYDWHPFSSTNNFLTSVKRFTVNDIIVSWRILSVDQSNLFDPNSCLTISFATIWRMSRQSRQQLMEHVLVVGRLEVSILTTIFATIDGGIYIL